LFVLRTSYFCFLIDAAKVNFGYYGKVKQGLRFEEDGFKYVWLFLPGEMKWIGDFISVKIIFHQ